MTIVNHHVPQPVIDTVWKDTKDFFDLSTAEKAKMTSKNEAECVAVCGCV
jgi:isopenicillin N synthase-like dioxygenase